MKTRKNNSEEHGSGPREERPSKRPRLSDLPTREVGLMRSIPGDKYSGFVGSASGIYFIRSVYGVLSRPKSSAPDQHETPDSDIVPGEDDHLPTVARETSSSLWESHEIDARPKATASFQELIDWSGSYFTNWHPFYPFLHAPTILEFFETLARDGITQCGNESDVVSTNYQVIVIKSIMSISLADRRQAQCTGEAYPTNLIHLSYDDAVDSLQNVLSQPTSILGLQAAMSVQLFLVSMLRLNAASRLDGLVNRMAMQLGLHRCPARYSTFSPSEKNLRQRIFWSLYAFDRFLCQSMGLPLGINDDDVDVCFPTSEHHTSSLQLPQSMLYHKSECVPDVDLSTDAKLDLLAFHARQSRLRGEIIELRNKSLQYVQKNGDQARTIEANLSQWWNDIEAFNDSEEKSQLSRYQKTILTMLKHESIISLNRPVLAAAHKGADYDAALQLCIGSARSIIMTLHEAINPSGSHHNGPHSLVLLWPSCTWAVWISTFVLFYAASTKVLSNVTVARLAIRSLDVLQHLARRGSAWPETSAAAIKDLRTRMLDRGSGKAKENDRDALGNLSQESNDSLIDTRRLGNESEFATRSNSDYGLSGFRRQSYEAIHVRSDTDNNEAHTEASQQHSMPTQSRAFGDASDNTPSLNTAADISTQDVNNIASSDFLNTQDSSEPCNYYGMYSGLDPFSGFDIPFWFEQDQHCDIFQDFK